MTDRRLAAVLVLVALLARVVAWLGTAIFGTDGGQMLRMADHFTEGRWGEAMRIGYHPLYPLLISVVRPLLGSEQAGFAVSIALGSAAVVPLFLAARDAVGRPAAFFGGLLYGVYPHLVELHADVMTEATFMFFLFSAIWLGWEAVKEPNWTSAILAGTAAAAAHLTRPEGILAVVGVPCWMAASLWRGRPVARLAGAGLATLVAMVVMFPYLLWARKEAGRWTVSAKGSVQAVEGAQERRPEETQKFGEKRVRKPWSELVRHLGKVTYFYFVPLLVLGALGLRRSWATPYWLSFPLLYWLVMAGSTARNPYTSYRYFLPGMALLLPLAVGGMIWLLGRLRRPHWLPYAMALAVLTCVPRFVRPHRADERPFRAAGAWIAGQEGRRTVFSTTDKVSYLAGSPMRDMPADWETLLKVLPEIDYIVYRQEDLDKKSPPYLRKIREQFGEPKVFGDPPVYVHRVR